MPAGWEARGALGRALIRLGTDQYSIGQRYVWQDAARGGHPAACGSRVLVPLSLTPPCPHSCALPLQEMVVHGVPTTAPFHCLILENEEFKKGNVDTGFIPKHQESLTVRRGGLEAAGTGRLVWVCSSAHAATRWRCL